MTMNETHIFLANDNNKGPFLSIPKQDIQRLVVYPHKWLKFIMFTICGAHGKLFFQNSSLRALPSKMMSAKPTFDRLTSTAKTRRAIDFRQKILSREEYGVVTEDEAEDCDAAHIIAVNKCDAVRSHLVRPPVLNVKSESLLVARARRSISTWSLPSAGLEISDIDDVRNGMLLSKTLHSKFRRGNVAFLRVRTL
jgi:hypothetical protein